MFGPAVRRFALASSTVGVCALLAGCISGDNYFSNLLASRSKDPPSAKPVGSGHSQDADPKGNRIVLRPETCSARVRGTQVFIATVYGSDGKPKDARRVEWMLEGPGSIIEVDDSGRASGRGTKFDNKYAYSSTASAERSLNRAGADFTIRRGQTWCVITSPVEGVTTVTAYAPAVTDWNTNRAYARLTWNEGTFEFPPAATARAGGEHTFGTRVAKDGAGPNGYRIRYRILDGPPAALTSTKGQPVDSVTEAVTTVDADGEAKVNISQPAAAAGTNRIAIEVIKPNLQDPSQFSIISTGETKITWQEPQLGVKVSAPKSLALNQDVTVTYTVTDSGQVEAGAVTLTAKIPAGMNVLQTSPRAAVDGDEMIWTLPEGALGKPQTVKATFRPVKVGSATLTADARAVDGTAGRGSVAVNVSEAGLLLKLEGPATGIVGESLPFRLTVTNTGDLATGQVRLQARLPEGLEVGDKSGEVEKTVASLSPGQSKTVNLPVSARRSGKHEIQITAVGEGNLVAPPQDAIVDVKDVQLGLTVHGPSKGYVGEEVTWTLAVHNGESRMGRTSLRASLPPEVTFIKATNGGKVSRGQVIWDLEPFKPGEERLVSLTVACDKPTGKTTLSATVAGTPVSSRDGGVKTVSLAHSVGPDKPVRADLEIVGVPALQMSVKDSKDPISVGERTTYTIKVKNAGTMVATNVVVAAETMGATAPPASGQTPMVMRPIRATGPGKPGAIDGQRITFLPLPTLAPNAEATFVIEVEGVVPGDALIRVEVRSERIAQPLRAEEPTRILGSAARPIGQ